MSEYDAVSVLGKLVEQQVSLLRTHGDILNIQKALRELLESRVDKLEKQVEFLSDTLERVIAEKK